MIKRIREIALLRLKNIIINTAVSKGEEKNEWKT